MHFVSFKRPSVDAVCDDLWWRGREHDFSSNIRSRMLIKKLSFKSNPISPCAPLCCLREAHMNPQSRRYTLAWSHLGSRLQKSTCSTPGAWYVKWSPQGSLVLSSPHSRDSLNRWALCSHTTHSPDDDVYYPRGPCPCGASPDFQV